MSTIFHPELDTDTRIHKSFIEMIQNYLRR